MFSVELVASYLFMQELSTASSEGTECQILNQKLLVRSVAFVKVQLKSNVEIVRPGNRWYKCARCFLDSVLPQFRLLIKWYFFGYAEQ